MKFWLNGLYATILLLICIALYIGHTLSVTGHQGPIDTHFNGRYFHNIAPTPSTSFLKILLWRLTREVPAWQPPIINTAINLPKHIRKNETCITPIFHACTLIQTHDANILTDPIWRERASPFDWIGPKRIQPPALTFKQLPRIHYVLISHNHYDSMDLPTLKRLMHRDHPTFITGLGNQHLLKQHHLHPLSILDWWQKAQNTNIPIQFVPAQHFSGRGLFDRNKTLWGGFILNTPGGTVYFSGDTGLGSFMRKIQQRSASIRMALLPIGAYQPRHIMKWMHMNPNDAVKALQYLKAQQAIGVHFDSFEDLADEQQFKAKSDLRRALHQQHIQAQRFITPPLGSSVCWTSSSQFIRIN
jgi:L-ascorbate metabolism protein UlaG (beta-lactamase superfamily)